MTMTILTSYTVNYLFQLKVTGIDPDLRAGSFTDTLHILRGDAAASRNMFNHILVTRRPPSVSQGCLFLNIERHLGSRCDQTCSGSDSPAPVFLCLLRNAFIYISRSEKYQNQTLKPLLVRFDQPVIILYL